MSMTTPLRPRVTAALNRRGLIGLAAALAALLVIVGSSVWQSTRNAAALTEVDRTAANATALKSLLLAVDDCETSQRGYLLTRQVNLPRRPIPRPPKPPCPALIGDVCNQPGRRRPGRWTAWRQVDRQAKLAELARTVQLA